MTILNTDPAPYDAYVLADSIADGVRLTTLVVKMPRIVLAEFNTHRVFSRNSASSRAIPVRKRIKMIEADPFVPLSFGRNRRGMQATEELDEEETAVARRIWLEAKNNAVRSAQMLRTTKVHKQLANRLLEPFAWHTVIVTATEWANFFALRISPNAQPEIRRCAESMKRAMDESTPRELMPGDWHLPLVSEEDTYAFDDGDPGALPSDEVVHLSVARCARVSYLTHGGDREITKDLDLYGKLVSNGHMSPSEHAAVVGRNAGIGEYADADLDDTWIAGDQREEAFEGPFIGNFRAPWIQHRKLIPGEAVYGGE